MNERGIAYCAPGMKVATALALMLRGETVSEVIEHPYLAGSTDVLSVNPDAFAPQEFLLDPEAFRMSPATPRQPEEPSP